MKVLTSRLDYRQRKICQKTAMHFNLSDEQTTLIVLASESVGIQEAMETEIRSHVDKHKLWRQITVTNPNESIVRNLAESDSRRVINSIKFSTDVKMTPDRPMPPIFENLNLNCEVLVSSGIKALFWVDSITMREMTGRLTDFWSIVKLSEELIDWQELTSIREPIDVEKSKAGEEIRLLKSQIKRMVQRCDHEKMAWLYVYLAEVSYYAGFLSDADKALHRAKSSYDEMKTSDAFLEAKILFLEAQNSARTGEITNAFKLLEKAESLIIDEIKGESFHSWIELNAIPLMEQLEDKVGTARTKCKIAGLLHLDGKHNDSLSMFKNNYPLLSESGHAFYIVETAIEYGELSGKKNFDKMREILRDALPYAEKMNAPFLTERIRKLLQQNTCSADQ